MSKPKHTPAPWTIRAAGTAIVYGNIQVAIVCRHEASNGWAVPQEANANLIAAAPEMLEALRGAWAAFQRIGCAAGDEHRLDAIKSAIAKAVGAK